MHIALGLSKAYCNYLTIQRESKNAVVLQNVPVTLQNAPRHSSKRSPSLFKTFPVTLPDSVSLFTSHSFRDTVMHTLQNNTRNISTSPVSLCSQSAVSQPTLNYSFRTTNFLFVDSFGSILSQPNTTQD